MDRSLRSPKKHALVRRAASLVFAAVALSAAGPARADDPAPSTPFDATQTQAATDIAKSFWHATPCADTVAITWSLLAESTNATSSWANPVGAYDAPEQNSLCSIVFNAALAWDWTRFCSVLVHEYGHLSGHDHATDPADVMYPYYVEPVAECEAAAPAQPAVQPALTAAAASLPDVTVVAQSQRKVRRAILVVVREPRKLRGKAMHPHRARRHQRLRMHRARA